MKCMVLGSCDPDKLHYMSFFGGVLSDAQHTRGIVKIYTAAIGKRESLYISPNPTTVCQLAARLDYSSA
eukprot:6468403-Amphidinium_carterae.1